jgi:hypothetical protein
VTHRVRVMLLMLSAGLPITGCSNGPTPQQSASAEQRVLVGAWRSKVVFRGGPLAEMKVLEFLLAYNAGGTMTESSNYDEAANSSPPAYGVWRQTGARSFETKYLFFTTQAPDSGAGVTNRSDWWPAGHGVLTEAITLSEDGQTYVSTITLALFDKSGAPIAGGGDGTGAGTRIAF